MTRIFVDQKDDDLFYCSIPVYFHGKETRLRELLKARGYSFDSSSNQNWFRAFLEDYPDENNKPELTIEIIYNHDIRDTLGNSGLEIILRGSATYSPVGERIVERLIKDLFFTEIDFGAPDIYQEEHDKVKALMRSKRDQRYEWIKHWCNIFNLNCKEDPAKYIRRR